MPGIRSIRGFTFVELAIVIVVLGILAAVAMRQMAGIIDDARVEQTRQELEQLALAIAGNPALISDGERTDFGFVGDVGRLPTDLSELVQNPGYRTWDGPYIDPSGALTDAWGAPYQAAGLTIRSIGSGEPIDYSIAGSAAAILQNSIGGVLSDASRRPPGETRNESATVMLYIPDGTGDVRLASVDPHTDGSFRLERIPVGNYRLLVTYAGGSDTLEYPVCVTPGSDVRLDLTLPADLW